MIKDVNKKTITYDKELIKEIIADGYDRLDIISLETDISIEDLLSIKKEVEIEKKQKKQKQSVEKLGKDYSIVQKMKQLRQNYELLYYGRANGENVDLQINIEKEEITKAIQSIEEIIDDQSMDVKEKASKIIKKIKNIEQEEFSIEQAYRLVSLLYNEERMPRLNSENKLLIYILNKMKRIIVRKLVKSIEDAMRKNK